ncbi:MAG: Hg(II)-responsive transcriptional regulator [Gammaproteobacteria bacterium]|nr:Hg(II)-responsive transcriptional regulator [Gammaproteobacteria bacterium]
MHETENGVTIGGLAAAAGVGVETIRFYQRKGLLVQPQRTYGGVRRYGVSALARVRFIKSAQRLGFRLEEIAELLKLDDGAHCDDARQMAETKLQDVRLRLADLQRIETVLAGLVEKCCSATGDVTCPLIASLQAE